MDDAHWPCIMKLSLKMQISIEYVCIIKNQSNKIFMERGKREANNDYHKIMIR